MINRALLFLLVTSGFVFIAGCASSLSRLAGSAEQLRNWYDERQEMRDILTRERQATRDALREERQALLVSQEACRESQREAIQDQIQQSVQSKISFDVNQFLRVGQLQVNQEKMRELLEDRDKRFKDRQKLIDELNEEGEREYQQALKNHIREQMRQKMTEPVCGVATREEVREDDCRCQPVDCGCQVKPCHCRLRHKCVCGKRRRERPSERREPLVQAPQRAPVRQNVRQPLLPMEIPLMLPVTLEFGMENPRVEETRIRRQPLMNLQAREPVREPVREKKPCCPKCGKVAPSCGCPGTAQVNPNLRPGLSANQRQRAATAVGAQTQPNDYANPLRYEDTLAPDLPPPPQPEPGANRTAFGAKDSNPDQLRPHVLQADLPVEFVG